MDEYQPDLLSGERFGRRLRDALSRRWGSTAAPWSPADQGVPRLAVPEATMPASSRLWYAADGMKADLAASLAVLEAAPRQPEHDMAPRSREAVAAAEPDTEWAEVCAASDRRAAEALRAAVDSVFGLDPGAFPEDTVILPVVGDRVFYGHGSGHLVGLEGVVVRNDDEPDLPPGLRSVQFDGEAWPNVVVVTALQRL